MNAPLRPDTLAFAIPPSEAADLVMSFWQRRQADYRSRAREAWQMARRLRRYVAEHSWHMGQDDINQTLEHAGDLRKEAAELVREFRRQCDRDGGMSPFARFYDENGGVLIECPRCNGEGYEEHVTGYSRHDGSPTGYRAICSLCDGHGEIEDEAQPAERDDDLEGAA